MELVKAISDYGSMIVLCSIFLYFIVKFLNLVVAQYDSKLNKKQHDTNLDMRNSVNTNVQSLISNLIHSCDGDRVQVVEFTNSVMSVAYLPFRFMTCTYEVYRYGECPASYLIDHVSTSLFTPFFEKLSESEYYIFNRNQDVDKSIMGGAMWDIFNQMHETNCIATMLTSSKGKALGYISLMKDEICESDIDELLEIKNKVSGLLSVLDT